MLVNALMALTLAAPPMALRVEIAPLGKAAGGTVMGVVIQVAPEDRSKLGERARVAISLTRAGRVVDAGDAVVELATDGSALLYREWTAGEGDVKVVVESLDGSARGGWTGKVAVPVMTQPFTAPEGAAAPEAIALAATEPAAETVRFLAPDKQGGVGAVLLEVDAPKTTARVDFSQDGEVLFQKQRPPWTASVTLGTVAKRTTVKAQAFAGDGTFLGEDAIVLNAPPNQIPVELLFAPAKADGSGEATITVAVGRTRAVTEVVLRIDEEAVARWKSCPCVARVASERLKKAKVVAAEASGAGGLRGEAVKVLGVVGVQEAVRVEVVELPVTVVDRQGRLVRDLPRQAFRVFEDNREVEPEGFARTSELALQVGLLVDVSGSMLKPFPEVRKAVAGFAEELLRKGDSYFLMTFSWETRLVVPWTVDAGALAPGLERVTPDGGTALHDALIGSLEQMRGRRGRTALVLLSDGDDTTSRTAWDVVMRYVKTMRSPIFTVGFQISKLDFFIRQRLREIADATGGEAFFAPAKTDLADVYTRIGEHMRGQYLLTYSSPSSQGAEHFRTIRVEVKGEGLTAKTMAGYFPAP
jgi:Ca-activated chloride channel homolog